MKMKKRVLIVVALAVCLTTVTAAAAFGAVWKDKGTNVTTHVTIGLSGGEVFETGTGGMSCEVFATITTTGGSTGKITKWEVKNCGKGFDNLLGCTVAATEAKDLPWTIDVNATDLTVTGARLRRTFKAGCAVTEIDKTVSLTMTTGSPSAITGFEFLGTTGTYKQFGSFTVDSPNSGTYGIG